MQVAYLVTSCYAHALFSSSKIFVMPTFVIEREIDSIGEASSERLKEISQQSCDVLKQMSSEIKWNHSYITDNKIYCVYEAPSEDLIVEHARMGGFPANSISKVAAIIGPETSK